MRIDRLAAAGLIVMVAAACAAEATDGPPATNPSTAAPAAVSMAPPSSVPSQPASPGAALEDIWHTPILESDAAWATLREAGLQKWIQPLRALPEGPAGANQYTLRITGGRWILYESRDSNRAEEIDAGTYTIDGNSVTVHHDANYDQFNWVVDGDTLRLTFAGTDFLDGYKGIPEEVFQTYLYMTSPFTRGAP